MISNSTMIASLGTDVRGRLRGDPTDPQLREFARMQIESRGDCCPRPVFAEAVDEWVALDCPEPVLGDPSCPHCGDRLEHRDLGSVEATLAELSDPLSCQSCDLRFGPSYLSDPERSVALFGWGDIPGM